MYRTGKGNFLIHPPQNQVGECPAIPLTSLLLFTRMTFFQTYHPKKAIFDGFYTDFEEFRRKKLIFGKSHSIKKKVFLNFHFGKKFCVYALLYDVQAFQKITFGSTGGIFRPTAAAPTRADERECYVKSFKVCRCMPSYNAVELIIRGI